MKLSKLIKLLTEAQGMIDVDSEVNVISANHEWEITDVDIDDDDNTIILDVQDV